MAKEGGGGNNDELYGVLGLNKDCSRSELRHAYKKLVLKWHPDRCSASGNPKAIEEAKSKFQAIQQAYSVLSDENKRFLYDVGVYDNDEDQDGMGDFLNEMVSMMSQTTPEENGEESLEELQKLLDQMFESDNATEANACYASSSSSTYVSFKTTYNSADSDVNNVIGNSQESFHFDHAYNNFCLGTNGAASRYEEGERRKKMRGS
ncbi:uncharacterized protein LOC114711943 isoform X2 [Neltuma alba]|uniref:uncharacterized protein LOC114711943 isoform X2 n=1 Tax=Neltuma alba TaxID=207710 RepID=UPI0010A33210|nr:uncharacterized protein LOC114711943 isoform X2 [Prosopis alba]